MNENRDYIPTRERNVKERLAKGASIKDGLAGRTTVQKDGAHYRTYLNKDGSKDTMKPYLGTNGEDL